MYKKAPKKYKKAPTVLPYIFFDGSTSYQIQLTNF